MTAKQTARDEILAAAETHGWDLIDKYQGAVGQWIRLGKGNRRILISFTSTARVRFADITHAGVGTDHTMPTRNKRQVVLKELAR